MDMYGMLVACRINVMSYDFYGGSFSNINKLNAPIVDCQSRACGKPFDISSGLQDYLAAGVPASKLVLGLATYGRTYGLNQPGGNPAPGTAATTGEYAVTLHIIGVAQL